MIPRLALRLPARIGCLAAIALQIALPSKPTNAEMVPARGMVDARIRSAPYDGDQVYRVRGFVGYQIDFEFEPGETFVGLGAGDIEGLSYFGQDNHLFLKPKAAKVATNLTVLTNRRRYQIDYSAVSQRPEPGDLDVIFAVRFVYPPVPSQSAAELAGKRIDAALGAASAKRPQYQ
jgi:type IV secretion system protein VirB9